MADSETELTPGKEETGYQGAQIEYQFYSKPMANPIVILQRSALTEGTKIATKVAELHRRWKNTWEGASKEEFEAITLTFMDNLIGMGYAPNWREKVLTKALIGYKRILKKSELGITVRNRPGSLTATKRRFDRLCGNQEWFRIEDDEVALIENEKHRTQRTKKGSQKNQLSYVYTFDRQRGIEAENSRNGIGS